MNKNIENLNWRYAVKKFDTTKKLSSEKLDTLIEAASLTPASLGLQTYKLIVIKDQKVKEELVPFSFNQPQISDCSELLVLVAQKEVNGDSVNSYLEFLSSERGIPLEALEQYKGMMMGWVGNLDEEQKQTWVDKQAYIALGNILNTAANERIDSCPMEGFDKTKYDEILGLEKLGLRSVVICPVGYRSAEDDTQHYKKVRIAKADFAIEI
jgi:nitroreductase